MDTSSGTLKFNTSVWHFDAVRWEVSITSGYRLKRAFGNCTTIATNNKFVILKATKVRKQR